MVLNFLSFDIQKCSKKHQNTINYEKYVNYVICVYTRNNKLVWSSEWHFKWNHYCINDREKNNHFFLSLFPFVLVRNPWHFMRNSHTKSLQTCMFDSLTFIFVILMKIFQNWNSLLKLVLFHNQMTKIQTWMFFNRKPFFLFCIFFGTFFIWYLILKII